jgi:hypothetical protein
LYAPSELLQQVEQQVRSEFKDKIVSFEWWNEEEYTTIIIEIREVAWQIPVDLRCGEIVYDIIGHPESSEYIVPILVRAIESVDATDGLFNLTYHGGGINSFFMDYYAPERSGSNPFILSFFYTRMFKALRTIHLDSASEFWERLIRPIDETYAKQEEVLSFRKNILAEEWRDFLLKHLDFIKHIAEVTREPLQILEAVPIRRQSSNGTEPQPLPAKTQSRQRWGGKGGAVREMALAVAAA